MRDKFGNNGYHSHLAEEALSTTTASGDLCVSLGKLAKLQRAIHTGTDCNSHFNYLDFFF